jgi:hypothetical protein
MSAGALVRSQEVSGLLDDCCLPYRFILSLFYLIFVYLFALSQEALYRLPLAIDRLINIIPPKLFRLTTYLPGFHYSQSS